MKIQQIATEEIQPYHSNPRFNDDTIPSLKKSIQEFGFQQPIVLDKDKVIIVGHARFKAAKELGLTELPCVIADKLSEDKIKAYRILDNKISEKSKWNNQLLSLELSDIKLDLTPFDMKFLSTVSIPEVSYSQEAVEKQEAINEKRFSEVKTLRTICCPECGEEFEID